MAIELSVLGHAHRQGAECVQAGRAAIEVPERRLDAVLVVEVDLEDDSAEGRLQVAGRHPDHGGRERRRTGEHLAQAAASLHLQLKLLTLAPKSSGLPRGSLSRATNCSIRPASVLSCSRLNVSTGVPDVYVR